VTLTLTSDDLESDIIVNDSLTLTNTTVWFVDALSLIVDVWMYFETADTAMAWNIFGLDLDILATCLSVVNANATCNL